MAPRIMCPYCAEDVAPDAARCAVCSVDLAGIPLRPQLPVVQADAAARTMKHAIALSLIAIAIAIALTLAYS